MSKWKKAAADLSLSSLEESDGEFLDRMRKQLAKHTVRLRSRPPRPAPSPHLLLTQKRKFAIETPEKQIRAVEKVLPVLLPSLPAKTRQALRVELSSSEEEEDVMLDPPSSPEPTPRSLQTQKLKSSAEYLERSTAERSRLDTQVNFDSQPNLDPQVQLEFDTLSQLDSRPQLDTQTATLSQSKSDFHLEIESESKLKSLGNEESPPQTSPNPNASTYLHPKVLFPAPRNSLSVLREIQLSLAPLLAEPKHPPSSTELLEEPQWVWRMKSELRPAYLRHLRSFWAAPPAKTYLRS